jgi:AcrR family transcriptional regulator
LLAPNESPSPIPPGKPTDSSPRPKYRTQLRQEQNAATRDRILTAALDLAHQVSSWDWHELTVRNVARQAGISERTIYRHFSNEHELHEAVQHRIELESGAPLRRNPRLQDLPDEVARVFEYLSTFQAAGPRLDNPPFLEVHRTRQAALLRALDPYTRSWSESDRRLAAALVDVLGALETFDRITHAWGLTAEEAAKGVSTLTQYLVNVIAEGTPPWRSDLAKRAGPDPVRRVAEYSVDESRRRSANRSPRRTPREP